jgi:putative heme-binding domain-containing protein
MRAGWLLAFESAQLARARPDRRAQLESLAAEGVLGSKVEAPRPGLRMADPYARAGRAASLAARARSYLHVNCAHCHRPEAGAMARVELAWNLPLAKTALVEAPVQGGFGLADAALVAPGDPFRSVLLYRLSTAGAGRMPRLGAQAFDEEGIRLIERWIGALPRSLRGPTRLAPGAGRKPAPPTPPLVQTTEATLARQFASTESALRLARALADDRLPKALRDGAITRGAAHERMEIRGLFDRFLPANAREERLGESIDRRAILGLSGDVARGRQLFETAAGCATCHRPAASGESLGPDLGDVGRRRDRAYILDSILEPSKDVDPKYAAYALESTDGIAAEGRLLARDEREVVLIDARGERAVVPAHKVKSLTRQPRSAMPDLLLAALTAQQAADLVAYLESCR